MLRTEHRTEHGAIEVTDALLVKRAEDDAAVDVLPRLQLVRRVRCTEGSVPVRAELLPRFDFGLTSAHVQQRGEQGWTAMGGEDALAIWSDLDLDESTWARVAGETMLEEGDERWFSFCYLAPEKIVDGVTDDVARGAGRRARRTPSSTGSPGPRSASTRARTATRSCAARWCSRP